MFLITLFLELYVRKALTLCSTMVNQRTDSSHSKSKVCRLVQMSNVVLGENKDTHGISRSFHIKIDAKLQKALPLIRLDNALRKARALFHQ